MGLLRWSAWGNSLVAELSDDVATHCGAYLELVLGWQAAQILQIRGNGLADHDRTGESEPLLFAQVRAAPHFFLGLMVAERSSSRRRHSIRVVHEGVREHVVLQEAVLLALHLQSLGEL